MPGVSWGQTEKRAMVTRLLQTAHAAQADGMTDLAAELRSRADQRKADPAWSVTVKTVGSPKDPLRFDALMARGDREVFRAKERARAELTAMGGVDSITPESVALHTTRDPDFKLALGALYADWFAHGVEGGEAEMARVYALGGSVALRDAVYEVRRFNEVSGPLA